MIEAAFQPRPRATPLVDPDRRLPDLVTYAYERQKATRNDEKPYRPSRTLQPGETADVVVEATEGGTPPVSTSSVAGTGSRRPGSGAPRSAAAAREGVTPWPVVGDAFGGVVNLVERGLRRILANPEAELAGARREATQPLMVLVGLVANEVTDAQGRVAERERETPGGPEADHRCGLRRGCRAARVPLGLRQRRVGRVRQQQRPGHADGHPAAPVRIIPEVDPWHGA